MKTEANETNGDIILKLVIIFFIFLLLGGAESLNSGFLWAMKVVLAAKHSFADIDNNWLYTGAILLILATYLGLAMIGYATKSMLILGAWLLCGIPLIIILIGGEIERSDRITFETRFMKCGTADPDFCKDIEGKGAKAVLVRESSSF